MKKILILLLLFILLPLNLAQAAESLAFTLKGKILLQVQSNGEAWYINPVSLTRYYLGRPADAFRIMREQGLGISNKDYNLFNGLAPANLAGKILLRVQDKGQAYYVNPVDLKMNYLGRPADAFAVMRNLGLGITDNNLKLISIDKKSSPLIVKETPTVITPEDTKPGEEPETGSNTTATTTDSGTTGQTATTSQEVITDNSGATASSSCVWLAEYFDNKKLIGDPVATSTVDAINFDWGTSGPSQVNRVDNFSIRFTANCNFDEANYEFNTVFDDALRVYFDGENFLQSWTDNDRTMTIDRQRNITKGMHQVKVEYYEAARYAKISVSWTKPN